ncbi:MAG: ribonuclease HII [Candidatus Latescibacterota bacterium]|nr:MAG: ribonuclease HII [Candidatus Latescibacterota bacterium]
MYRRLEAFDRGYLREGEDLLAGLDEAGRGALAGPVVAAAVILPRDSGLLGVDDSKRLTESRRETLFSDIVGKALSVGISVGQPSLIDTRNILNATLIAMARAVRNLGIRPATVLVDGRDRIQYPAKVISVIGGDRKSLAVAAASIVAKVTRDRLMRRLHKRYPAYNFLNNKGYGTKEHLNAISRYGTVPAHRKSYRLKSVEKSLSLF